MDEVADSNSVAPTTFSLSRFTSGGAFLGSFWALLGAALEGFKLYTYACLHVPNPAFLAVHQKAL